MSLPTTASCADPTPPHPAARPTDHELVRGRHLLGGIELLLLTDGTYLLDGGAMFGVVPKTLWQRRMQADAENRVLLGLNCVVVRTGQATVLIETGIGNKQNEKMRAIHRNQMLLPQALAAAGIDVRQVTHVVNTHLHFDHCGWNTTLDPDGTVRPTFPNARYLAPRGEVEHGHLQLDRDRVSYLAPNYDPLIASGQMTLVEDGELAAGYEIVPGLWAELLPGHTAHMLGVHMESGGRHACFVGDLVPTAQHLNPTWVMGYDLDPLRTIAERKRLLARAMAEQWLLLFPHDHHIPAATLDTDAKGAIVARPLLARHVAG